MRRSLNVARGRIVVLAWAGLWITKAVLGRAVQPTLFMSFLATGILTLASAALLASAGLAFGRHPQKLALRTLVLVGAASSLGVVAALLIRGLYAWLYPDVRPFGLAFNIAVDIGWVSLHALFFSWSLQLLRH